MVTGHLHTLLFCLPLFSFCVPPRFFFRPFWPCVPILGVFFGVPFWAPRVFGILLELTGLELARPFRGTFLGTRGGKGFSVLQLPELVGGNTGTRLVEHFNFLIVLAFLAF